MAEKPKLLQDTTEDVRRQARVLLRSARSLPLATLDAATGFPAVSRALTGMDVDGSVVILISGLSQHFASLMADPRCSVMAGEPGKGDPLAHPRLTVQCKAERVSHDDARHSRIRSRFLRRHPKAQLYVDFPDFAFFRLVPDSASFNGGFGKAYVLEGRDLLIDSPAVDALAEMEDDAIAHMANDHPEAATVYAAKFGKTSEGNWCICGLDASGLDLSSGDSLMRVEYDEPLKESAHLRFVLKKMYN